MLDPDQEISEPVFQDKNDFTRTLAEANIKSGASSSSYTQEHKKTKSDHCNSFMFSYFPYFLIGVVFLSVATFNGSDFTDLISIGYVMLVFYYIANFRAFYS